MGEDVSDGGGEPREEGVELGMDLIARRRVLADRVAAMANQGPELGVDLVEQRLDEAEAGDGGAPDGGGVGVVGLVAGVGGEAERAGRQGVDDAGFEPGGDDGPPDRAVNNKLQDAPRIVCYVTFSS